MSSYSGSVLRAMFRRSGGISQHTNYPEELSNAFQREIRNTVSLEESEEVVFASLVGNSWFLITTERLFCKQNGELSELRVDELVDATSDHAAEVLRGVRSKASFQLLRLLSRTGRELLVQVESGPPFFAIWSILKSIAKRNSRAAPAGA